MTVTVIPCVHPWRVRVCLTCTRAPALTPSPAHAPLPSPPHLHTCPCPGPSPAHAGPSPAHAPLPWPLTCLCPHRCVQGCGVIQGDGIDVVMLKKIMAAMEEGGYSADSVVYGMGGGLLQKVNRDTMSFATKLCHIVYQVID